MPRISIISILPIMPAATALVATAVTLVPVPLRAQAWKEKQVSFPGAEEGVTLAGSLALPDGPGPHPAVLFIAGTGDHERDQTISGFPMFRVMAERLALAGVASLRFDKRGVGRSTGEPWPVQTTSIAARDCRCALDFLRSRTGVDSKRVGAVGHSEGAMIAPRLVGGDGPPSFLVLLAPPARPIRDLYLSQRMRWFERRERSLEGRESFRRGTEKMIALASDPDASEASMREAAADILVGLGRPRDQIAEKGIQMVFSNYLTPWMREHMRDDPQPALRSIAVPLLAVFGGADEQVPWRRNLPALASCLAQATTSDVTVVTIPDQDHFFLRIPGRPPNVHEFGKMVMSEDLLVLMTRWIASRAAR